MSKFKSGERILMIDNYRQDQNTLGTIIGETGTTVHYTVKWDDVAFETQYYDYWWHESLLMKATPDIEERIADQKKRLEHAMRYL